VSESPLSTHAGPIAVIAGGLFAVAHVGQFVVMDGSNLVTTMLNPAFRAVQRRVRHHLPADGDCLPARPDSWNSPTSRDNPTLNHRNHRCGVTSRLVDGAAKGRLRGRQPKLKPSQARHRHSTSKAQPPSNSRNQRQGGVTHHDVQ
jgi:hypothetical protein